MEFRFVNHWEEESVKKLWSYCFEREDEPFFQWYFTGLYRAENTLAAIDRERLAAYLHLIPHRIFLRGELVPATFIVGVAVSPEYRGQGLAGRLLAAALSEMRQRGSRVCVLVPSQASFYYPYGWKICYDHIQYTIPLEQLRTIAAHWGQWLPVVNPDTIDQLDSVYKNYAAGRHGYIARASQDWRHILAEHGNEGGYAYLLSREAAAQAYILYGISQRKIEIKEMAFVSAKAQQAVFAFLYGHRSQADTVEWKAPPDDLTCLCLPDTNQGIRMLPAASGRIVDAAALLESIRYPENIAADLTLQLEDGLADWNNRILRLEISGGRATVAAAATGTAALKCQAGAFAQLVFGRLSAREIYWLGELAAEPATVAQLELLFPKRSNYMNDIF